VWVKLDDGFADHPKVARLSNEAFRLHVMALCYCARFLTDGVVPDVVTHRYRRAIPSLIDAGLWSAIEGGGGYAIHDWGEWNPTAEQVQHRRKAEAERQARMRVSRRDSRQA